MGLVLLLINLETPKAIELDTLRAAVVEAAMESRKVDPVVVIDGIDGSGNGIFSRDKCPYLSLNLCPNETNSF